MKRLFTILVIILFSADMLAQAPQKISYQAVIRDADDALVTNHAVGIRVSILDELLDVEPLYLEIHTATTNSNGLVTIEIGSEVPIPSDIFENSSLFLKTEIDPSGGNEYTITGTSQLLSVPYALYSETAASFTETQTLGDVLSLSEDGGEKQIKNIADPTDEQDAATKAYVDVLLARIESLELLNYGFTDARDNNHYNTVKIGNQIWMAENLKYLPSVVGPATSSETDPYYYVYGYDGTDLNAANATANYNTYGVLYNWPAAMNGTESSVTNPSGVQGVCPTGWHLPSDAEWTELTDYLGGTSIAGGKLKEIYTTHWTDPNTGASNETGFTARPGGARTSTGIYFSIGDNGYWWSATEYSSTKAYFRHLFYDNGNVDSYYPNKEFGISVRCVMD